MIDSISVLHYFCCLFADTSNNQQKKPYCGVLSQANGQHCTRQSYAHRRSCGFVQIIKKTTEEKKEKRHAKAIGKLASFAGQGIRDIVKMYQNIRAMSCASEKKKEEGKLNR